jgi:hypothetical protein
MFDKFAGSAELCFEIQFEPGDKQPLNSHVIVHSRIYDPARCPT